MTTSTVAKLLILSFAVCGCAARQVGAINPQSIPPGTEARMIAVSGSKDYIRMRVVAATRDSLRYQLNADAAPQSLPWQRIDRFDVTRGTHSNFFPGLGIGLLSGVAIGALIGSQSASGNDGYTPTAVGVFGAISGGVLGGIAGGAVGLLARTQTWIPVYIPRAVPAERSAGGQ